MIQVKKNGSTTTLATLEYNGTNITEAWVCDKTARTCTKVFPTMCITIPALCGDAYNDYDCTWVRTDTYCTFGCDLYGDWWSGNSGRKEFAYNSTSLSQTTTGDADLFTAFRYCQSPVVPLYICSNTSIPSTLCVEATYCFKTNSYSTKLVVTNRCACPAQVICCGSVVADCHCLDFWLTNPEFQTSVSRRVLNGETSTTVCVPICALATDCVAAQGVCGIAPKWDSWFSVCVQTNTSARNVCRCLVFTLDGNEVYNSGWRRACDELSFCI